jgi:RNA polymerase sigma-70 factor, ECF subfamily
MENLYQRYYKGISGFIRKKIDDEGVVEELTDDVLMSAIEAMPTFNKNCSEFSFICSIAKHKVIDYYRKKRIKTVLFSANPIFEEIADKALSPERDVLKNELKTEIEKTLQEMKEGYSRLLRLKYIDGWKIVKIAEMTATSIKSVESKLIRAKRQFQQLWIYDRKKAKETVGIGDTD